MDTFHLFPLFPFELRALIWRSTVQPRTVEVRVDDRGSGLERRLHLVSPTPVPATIQACREARNLGLYERAFSEIDADGRYVWVNWDIDIISIGTSYFYHFHPCALLIKRLQFERDNTEDSFYHWEINDLDVFVNVKEIYIVCVEDSILMGWHDARLEHWSHWHCGGENLYLIDMENDGRVMKAAELDARMELQYAKWWAEDGLAYPSGEPLNSESSTQGTESTTCT